MLNRTILRLAVPNILASLSAPLIGIADTAMIGHLPEVAYMGAVATAAVIFDFLFWSVAFLRMGTTSLVAQYFGAGDKGTCTATLYRALGLAGAIGLAVLVLQDLVVWIGFGAAGGSAEVQLWGARYFAVRIWGFPLALMVVALNGFFLGTAYALGPMFVTVAANIVNVVADYVLIYGKWGAPALGVAGAAWASVVANSVALVVAAFLFFWRYRAYWSIRVGRLWQRSQLGHMLRTNAHLFGRTMCLLLAQFLMLVMVSRMGEVPLAAQAVVLQVWAVVSFGVDGFAHAAETLVGNLLGRRDFAGGRRVARRIILWGAAIGFGFSLAYAFGLEPIARAFTEHRQVILMVASLKWLIVWIQPLNAVVYVFDGILIGANDMGYMFLAMAVALLVFFLPPALVFVYVLDWGIWGAWGAYNFLMVGRFVTLGRRYLGDAWLRSFIAH